MLKVWHKLSRMKSLLVTVTTIIKVSLKAHLRSAMSSPMNLLYPIGDKISI